ncbi:MAG: hypothetical protein ACPG3X_01400 [Opitutales bacterium]
MKKLLLPFLFIMTAAAAHAGCEGCGAGNDHGHKQAEKSCCGACGGAEKKECGDAKDCSDKSACNDGAQSCCGQCGGAEKSCGDKAACGDKSDCDKAKSCCGACGGKEKAAKADIPAPKMSCCPGGA